MNNKIKKAFQDVEGGMDDQNNMVKKRFSNLISGKPLNEGTQLPEVDPKMVPYENNYAGKQSQDVGELVRRNEIMQNIDASDKARQMKDLEDAENLAAFDDDPQSENNLRVQKLRALLGR